MKTLDEKKMLTLTITIIFNFIVLLVLLLCSNVTIVLFYLVSEVHWLYCTVHLLSLRVNIYFSQPAVTDDVKNKDFSFNKQTLTSVNSEVDARRSIKSRSLILDVQPHFLTNARSKNVSRFFRIFPRFKNYEFTELI